MLPHPAMLTLAHVGASLPHGKMRPSVPRAASSHSASVGSRLFAQAQYVMASARCTHPAGRLPPLAQSQSQVGAGHLPAVTHAEYWDCVTSVRSIWNALTDTICAGFSSSLHIMSIIALQPMVN